MSTFLDDIAHRLKTAFPKGVLEVCLERDELTVVVGEESLVSFMTFLRDDSGCSFEQLVDIGGVDYPGRKPRFDVVYHLLSLAQNMRLRVKVGVDEEGTVPSIGTVFPCALWYEREAWDMFGILFTEHPDLRRLLSDYDFQGHPLRKDFPLSGYKEVRYDEEQKKVVYEPLQLAQAYRDFDFLSPWEGDGQKRMGAGTQSSED
ncbi:MAG: NADH-quinone oxidoreductase subunit C [Alphaproteobacteria bacterium GM202ARS2]|nr:NADH-quinone oxidoreductase subunit C [Alphaproteobacteria bacterium GM202ARS2]